jgi:NAD(P)-dependent dehydrogenase (short-subunit alcohol dehydrogenase family)
VRGLKDKRIIVAGGATGIGAATAQRLAEEGAKVLVGDIYKKGLDATIARITEAGGTARGVHFDLRDTASAEALVQACLDSYGGVDGLANIAANLRDTAQNVNVLDMTDEGWFSQIDCNFVGYTRTIKAVLPHMVAQKNGTIVNTSSTVAFMGDPERGPYSAAKAAINALTRHVARRWGPDNIRCNSIAPGLVLSELIKEKLPEEVKRQTAAATPLRRGGEPAELAAAFAFLLSDDAAWITGQVWSVNGGMPMRE